MRASVLNAAWALLLMAPMPVAAAPTSDSSVATVKPLVGHYYLEGVMETGSELLLDGEGRFKWYLVYGALDLYAEGTWRQEGQAVLLTSERGEGQPEPGFKTLALTVRDGDLVPPDGKGAYVRAARSAPPTTDD